MERKLADDCCLSFRTVGKSRWTRRCSIGPVAMAQTMRWLDAYVYPAIGACSLMRVQPRDVMAITCRPSSRHAPTPP